MDAELYRSLLSSVRDVTDVPHQRRCDDTLVLRSQTTLTVHSAKASPAIFI